MSLRARLLALAVGSALAVLLLLAVPVVVTVQDAVEDDREQEAATLVQGVADLLSTGAASVEDLGAIVDRGRGRRGDDGVSVVLPDGSRLGEPREGCTTAAAAPDQQDADGELLPISPVTTTGVGGGTLVAVAAQTPGGVATVCSLVEDDEVREEVVERLGPLGLGGAAVLVVVAGLALLVARRVARHLEDAASTADRLAAGDLDARAVPAGPPEVRSVAIALNGLAARIDELLTLERETVADLSHRLRTPLTAVRLDVEALPGSPAKDELDEHVAQLERTLTAVIQAAAGLSARGRCRRATPVTWCATGSPSGRRCSRTRAARCPWSSTSARPGRSSEPRARTSSPRWTRCWRTPSRTPTRASPSASGSLRTPTAGCASRCETRVPAYLPRLWPAAAATAVRRGSASTSPAGAPRRPVAGSSSTAMRRGTSCGWCWAGPDPAPAHLLMCI